MSDDLPELTPLETAYRQALAAVRKEFIDAVMADKTASSKDMHVGLMCTLFGEVTHVLGSFPPALAQRYIDLFCAEIAGQVALSRADREAEHGSTVQ
jgi:hypothetical protein